MTQFLRSTLFPDFLRKKYSRASKVNNSRFLCTRIELLEKENQKSLEAIEALNTHCKNLSLMVTALAADVNTLASCLVEMQATVSPDVDILKPWDDDDDGYIH